jgi:hypothetical protein
VVAVVAACGGEPSAAPETPAPPPVLKATRVQANPTNVLSAAVVARVAGADSVGARFYLRAGPSDSDGVAPAVPVLADSVVVPVLGLLPDTAYLLRAVAFGAGGSTAGASMEFRTGSLPADLPRYTTSGNDPLPGYVVFAAGPYGLAIDNTGRVVWYRWIPPGGPGLNFMAQPTGRFVARPTTPDTADPDLWVELDPMGNLLRRFGCAGGLPARFHDLISEADGGYWIMCDETRVMDLSAVGGLADARVTGTVVQHVGPAGELLFQWSPFDHFAITDLELAQRVGSSVNWTHGNSLDLDGDGNLLVSFRSLGEITKINVATGAVTWRMGGLANQFSFTGTGVPPFARQHGVRLAAPGELVLLDNLGDPTASRAERYTFSDAERSARLEQAYGPVPPVVTPIGGSVQPLPGGRFLVTFGNMGKVQEVDATGRVTWQIEGNPGYVFRAQRIWSLYNAGLNLSR